MARVISDPSVRENDISRALVEARREVRRLPSFPGPLPDSLADAYRVQAISRSTWLDEIAGWKVGGIPPGHRKALGADFLAGPIFSRRVMHSDRAECVQMAVFADGFAAIEPEFVLQLGEAREADRLFIGAEIASSPIVAINDIGPLAVVCDFGNNNGVLLGDEIADWEQLAGQQITVETFIGGRSVGSRTLDDIPALVGAARDFLFDLAAREKFELSAGTLVSTGAITGVHDARAGDRSLLDFGTLGRLELELVPEKPFI
ncbi:MAG: 2-keto-4-pentenoate hydratase [Erythrobacter sp.]